MVEYKNGKIYMIYPKCEYDEGDVYYGSTAEIRLSARMSKHRSKYKNYINKCNSTLLFNKYGIENCIIELVEEYPCENKQQLEKREGYYIRNNKCVNKNIAGRTYKEYYEDNKDKMYEKNKQYRIDNEDYVKDYYEKNKDKILDYHKEYRIKNREKIKEYFKINKDKINEKNKENYEKNKDKINEKNKEKKECPFCSKLISQRNMKRHIDTIHSNS